MFKLITSLLVCAIVAILFVSNVMSVKEMAPPAPPPKPKTFDSEILWSLIQDWRVKNNLQSYIKDQKLCDYADKRLQEIHTDFSHNGFNKTSQYFLNISGFNYLGENLAKDYSSEQKMFDSWLNSPGHRENLDANYPYSCVRVDYSLTNNTSVIYAVQIFASY